MSEREPLTAQHASQLHGVGAPPEQEPVEIAKDPAPAKRDMRWGRRVAWLLAMIFVGVVVGLLIVGFMKFVDGTTEGTVAPENTLQKAKSAAAAAPAEPNLLSGLAIEFSYPGVFDTVAQVKTDARATEQYNVSSKSDYSRMIAVSVKELEGGNLDNDASFRMRQNAKDEYKQTDYIVGTDKVIVMAKLDNSEKTMFWVHGGREATVSITTGNPKDNVADMMEMVKSSLRWRK